MLSQGKGIRHLLKALCAFIQFLANCRIFLRTGCIILYDTGYLLQFLIDILNRPLLLLYKLHTLIDVLFGLDRIVHALLYRL